MKINDAVLQNREKVIFALRELYLSYGYRPYRMSKFEEYDLYASNKDFLVSDHVITFTDTDGKLMALKPDVTLSIIKNSEDIPQKTDKVFYNENVYRVSKGTGSFKEIMQTGVECFGSVGIDEVCEVLRLALESMNALSEDAVLAISDLEILEQIIAELQLSSENQRHLFQAIGEKNLPEIEKITVSVPNRLAVERLKKLLSIQGSILQTADAVEELLQKIPNETADRFIGVLRRLKELPHAKQIVIDFSVIGDPLYYNGIIFKGFLRDVPEDVLSGGQYDRLMQRMDRKSAAIGFAVYTDLLDRVDLSANSSSFETNDFVNIALPKGRLGEKVYDLFARAGFECPSILEPNRKLIFENPQKHVRYFWVKPSDVAIYVERGAADIGVAGKDILAEYNPEVYELLDLNCGKCRMAVAAPVGFADDPSATLRVATKFTNIAKNFYRSKGRNIDIIHLNGSIEIAPILGLSDVIVDIVETGTTLKENDLEVIDTVLPISARFIANKASYKFKDRQIKEIAAGIAKIVEESK